MQILDCTKPGAMPAVEPVYAPVRIACRAARGSEPSQDSLHNSLLCRAAGDMRSTSDCELSLFRRLRCFARLLGCVVVLYTKSDMRLYTDAAGAERFHMH